MEIKSFQITQKHISISERIFEGYASTFQKDLVGDVIHPGAFKKSISEAFPAGRIKVLWQHRDPLGMPVEMREDSKGLYVKARVSKTKLGDEALELMNDGVIDQMSIGFDIPVNKFDYDEKDDTRNIREVKLYEFSPVTFAANENAIITGVKNIHAAIKRGETITNSRDLLGALKKLTALLDAQPENPTVQIEPLAEMEELKELLKTVSNDAQSILTGVQNHARTCRSIKDPPNRNHERVKRTRTQPISRN